MSISVSCPHCRRPYRLKDEFADKRVKCRDCQGSFAVPATIPDVEELTPAGSPIYRYQEKSDAPNYVHEPTPFLAEISNHVERTIGVFPMVFHEVVSTDVHIDLHIVPPTGGSPSAEHPYGADHYTIVTSGMSSRPMNLPEGAPATLRYAELMVVLPRGWPGLRPDGTFDDELMKNEANWWPLRWLKLIARLPHEYGTYMGPGHTIPNGDPAEPFSRRTSLCCMLLTPPLFSPRSARLVINDDILINFYALWPIYREEMNFKLKRGFDPLVDRLEAVAATELVDEKRKNACARGFWPFGRK